jgi:hypothetical protein
MSELTQFLLARIAEDEASYQAAFVGYSAGFPLTPSRFLAECDAKRRTVEGIAIAELERTYNEPAAATTNTQMGQMIAALAEHLSTERRWYLQLLALPYANHPDYQEEWRV